MLPTSEISLYSVIVAYVRYAHMRHLLKGPVHVICFKVVGSPLSFIVWPEYLLILILLLHQGCLLPFTHLHLFYLLVLLPGLDDMDVALCVLFHEAALDELVEILLQGADLGGLITVGLQLSFYLLHLFQLLLNFQPLLCFHSFLFFDLSFCSSPL